MNGTRNLAAFSSANKDRVTAWLAKLLSIAVLGLTCSLGTSVHASVESLDVAKAFGAALEYYRTGHYAAAFGRFSSLADHQHVESARFALMMLRYGPVLYGTEWSATPTQLDKWTILAEQKTPINDFSPGE